MTQLDPRILNRVAGYWPGYRMTPQAIQAWTHKLAAVDPNRVLAALDEFSDENVPTPPRVGELAERIKTNQPAADGIEQMAIAGDWRAIKILAERGVPWALAAIGEPTDQHTKAA